MNRNKHLLFITNTTFKKKIMFNQEPIYVATMFAVAVAVFQALVPVFLALPRFAYNFESLHGQTDRVSDVYFTDDIGHCSSVFERFAFFLIELESFRLMIVSKVINFSLP